MLRHVVISAVFTVWAASAAVAEPATVQLVRAVTDADYLDDGAPPPARVELGRLLFFDPILSGNRNIACATCHHPRLATADGLSLSVGEGGRGVGPARDTGAGRSAIRARVPRNAPALFNLGAREFVTMFHDGRVEVDPAFESGFRSPVEDELPPGLDSVLAVQAMFPVTSADEMAGQRHENPIADAAHAGEFAGPEGVWAGLAARLRANAEYVELFVRAFDDVDDWSDISFVHAANAIAAFETRAFRADRSPFDAFMRGDRQALDERAMRGLRLFYGRARCGSCHAGPFQTDHAFHATAIPQVGPGKGHGRGRRDDVGRQAITGAVRDRYRFRTPTLRNVALTGPWGHDGAYATLEAAVRHMLDPVRSLGAYDRLQLVLPRRPDLDAIDGRMLDDPYAKAALAQANELQPIRLDDAEIDALIGFLEALTDPGARDLAELIPARVPSGLPVEE